ncbi:MAG TPA: hypothetical protein VER33_10890 [Polyangiaceae bacterium]|nr:hypothetical protein [Polyangiaceae bacterium]
MRNEYAQTYQARSSVAGSAQELTPPDSEGWTLHSWQLDPIDGHKLVLVWERRVVDEFGALEAVGP